MPCHEPVGLRASARAMSIDWLPDRYVSRFSKFLRPKEDSRRIAVEDPYHLLWKDHRLNMAWGRRPALIAGGRPYNKRQLAAYQNHLRRVSPLEWARRYQAKLESEPGMTKVDVARQFGVSRVRVVQYLKLLRLDPRVIETIDAHFSDPVVAATCTERRLRNLLATTAPAQQWRRFQEILQEARSNPGVWSQPNGDPSMNST